MTPSSALEYVRSRRPRVLLAPSQWKVSSLFFSRVKWSFGVIHRQMKVNCYFSQAVQEYKQWRLASTATSSPSSGDAVLITKADLEGYNGQLQGKELALVPRVAKTRPMIAKLSCLFASLKVSGGSSLMNMKLTEAPAC